MVVMVYTAPAPEPGGQFQPTLCIAGVVCARRCRKWYRMRAGVFVWSHGRGTGVRDAVSDRFMVDAMVIVIEGDRRSVFARGFAGWRRCPRFELVAAQWWWELVVRCQLRVVLSGLSRLAWAVPFQLDT